ncbi:hypothetical protein [Psychromonas sp. Urea-02u-13]|uniref:hypothetical protein n=1 Tax=Psychromonas sp. Urea-02u-13 TaxID=2058326 RepID=UPI000C32C08F|nr:hypothetical protein [Psychromonas sp. Urea-02u-13]PKG40631.1 hypothetical protein CXF74_02090 [Psychromonas sp. Urea-02u-13]
MIKSQINILAQAKVYLQTVTPLLYSQIVSPLFISSAGAHIRHILDHYLAIIDGLKVGCIDYDKRSRGGVVESETSAALSLISEIESFLNSLSPQQLQQTIKLSTEVCVVKKQIEVVETTLARELIFVGAHAIHHFAMIQQISKAQQISTPDKFGIAPATATFLRSNENLKTNKIENISNKKISDKKCVR